MIGGTLKTTGLLVIVVGVLAPEGHGAAGYGYLNEDENREGLLSDFGEREQNEALMTYGLVVAGTGLGLFVVGIVLAVAGESVSRRRRHCTRVLTPTPASAEVHHE